MNRKNIIWLLTALLGIACDGYLDGVAPEHELTAEKVLVNDDAAEAYTLSIYTSLVSMDRNLATSVPLYIDEMQPTPTSGSNAQEFYSSALSPDNNTVQSLWENLYGTIYKCNDAIELLDRADALTPRIKNQCLGEARFIRAYAYLLLVSLFGDVPLVTRPDVAYSASAGRTLTKTVLAAVIDDLILAKELMGTDYVAAARIRPNRLAAAALLARAYLYSGNHVEAESEASEVLQSPLYRLEPLDSVFLMDSRETIFQAWNVNGYQLGSSFAPGTGLPQYVAAEGLIAAFDLRDLRREKWFGVTEADGQTYHYLYKYRKTTAGPSTDEYTVGLRLAEQYLIRAEARLRQNQPDEAIADIDSIRFRAGLPSVAESYPNAGSEELLVELLNERYRELFSEWNHRFADLKRFDMINEVMGAKKSTWTKASQLFPIPATERRININLEQNDGYDN